MKKIFLLILFLLAVSGCAETVKQVTLPSGRLGFYVTCENGNSDWSTCHEEARKVCNGNYTVSDKAETSTATQWGPLVKRSMMVDCQK
jgi:uncharacterized protein YceK